MKNRVDWYAVDIFKYFLPGYVVLFLVPDVLSSEPEIGWGYHLLMTVHLGLLTGYMIFMSRLWIDSGKLIVKRFGKKIVLYPAQIGDWEALTWPPASRLHFLCETDLGKSVLFLPNKLPDWTYGGENTDSYDLLAEFKQSEL